MDFAAFDQRAVDFAQQDAVARRLGNVEIAQEDGLDAVREDAVAAAADRQPDRAALVGHGEHIRRRAGADQLRLGAGAREGRLAAAAGADDFQATLAADDELAGGKQQRLVELDHAVGEDQGVLARSRDRRIDRRRVAGGGGNGTDIADDIAGIGIDRRFRVAGGADGGADEIGALDPLHQRIAVGERRACLAERDA